MPRCRCMATNSEWQSAPSAEPGSANVALVRCAACFAPGTALGTRPGALVQVCPSFLAHLVRGFALDRGSTVRSTFPFISGSRERTFSAVGFGVAKPSPVQSPSPPDWLEPRPRNSRPAAGTRLLVRHSRDTEAVARVGVRPYQGQFFLWNLSSLSHSQCLPQASYSVSIGEQTMSTWVKTATENVLLNQRVTSSHSPVPGSRSNCGRSSCDLSHC